MSNYGTFNLSLVNSTEIQQLLIEINNNYYSEPNSQEIINILNDIKQGKEVTPNTLNKLWEFIKKYEPLISISSSLIQTIIAILGIA